MEPTLPTPQSNEGLPSSIEHEDYGPEVIVNAENSPNLGVEQPQELPQQTTVTPAITSQDVNVVAGVAQQVTADPQIVDDNTTNPAIADDVDVIEKEWVDKAKKIVSETKNDPYLQEQEVSKLQADYLMKRYGKRIKLKE